MTTGFRALISKNGTTQGITTADTLIVGDKIDAETGTLVIGGTNASEITIGKNGIKTTFPGNIDVQGAINTVSTTTFTDNAIFQGNVTFGNGPSDTVTFHSTTTVISDINFGGSSPTHRITNLADGTDPNDAVNKSQLDAVVVSLQTAYETNNTITTDSGEGNVSIIGDQDFVLGGSVDFNMTSTGGISATALTGTVDIATTGAFSVDGAVDSNISVSGSANLDIGTDSGNLMAYSATGVVWLTTGSTNVSAIQLSTTAGGVDLLAETGVSITSNNGDITAIASGIGNVVIESTAAAVLVDGAANSRFTVTSADLTLETVTSGSVNLTAAQNLEISANGFATTWPTSEGAANTFLKHDGAGGLSWSKADLTTDVSGILPVANGGTGTSTAFTPGSIVFAGASGVYSEDPTAFFWDATNDRLGIGVVPSALTNPERLNVSGKLAIAEGTAPSAESGYGKLYALSSNSRPYYMDDSGQAYKLTLDLFESLSYDSGTSTVTISASPALPIFKTISLTQDTTFATTGLGDGRSISVRVVCDSTTRTLTFPSGWTWLGSGFPSSLAAGKVGYLSITAYGNADTNVVAAWSYQDQPAAVTGSGVDNQIAVWSGTNTQDGSSSLTFNGTTLGVTGGITQTGGAVSLTGNASSSLTTSSGALTLTSAAAATWSTTAGNLDVRAGSVLRLDAATGASVVVNPDGKDLDFRVESDLLTHAIFVDALENKLFFAGRATTNTHTFNIGTNGSTSPAFAIASGGRIHYYDGSPPTNGQILIGNTTEENFEKSTLTAGAGITITQDSNAGTTTIAATGSGSVTSVGLSTTLSGLQVNNSPVTGSGTLELTGTLGVGGGGTGQTTLTSGALLVGNGNGAVDTVSPGADGQVLAVVSGAWAATSLPAATDYSTIAVTPTTATPGDAALITGAFAKANSQTTARVAGIATASAIKILGIIEDCNFETGLSTNLAVGQPVYLSATADGKLTNTAPSTLGQVVAELGIVALVNEATGGAAAADILWQPKPIVIL